jgi:hypothetical protein
MLTSNPELRIVWSGGREDPGMNKVAPVLTLALTITFAALAYAQDNAASPDLGPPVNVFNQTPLPSSGWANPNTRGPYESVNNSGDAESPSLAVPASPADSGTTLSQSSGDDNSNATSGNDANGSGWGTSDSSATGGSDSGGSDNGGSDPSATGRSDTSDNDSSATSGSDTGDSDSSATGGSDTGDSDNSTVGADDSAGASEMNNGSGDSDSNASGDSDSDSDSNTTSGDGGDSSTDSGGNDTSSSDSADSSGK